MKRSAYSSLSALSPNVNLSGYQLFLVSLFVLSFARATDNTVHGQSFSWARYMKNKSTSTVAPDASGNTYALASSKETDTYGAHTFNNLDSSYKADLAPVKHDENNIHRIPNSLELLVYPSPYFDQTTMSFIAPEDGVAHLAIFNIIGALIKEVFRGEVQAGQSYRFTANTADFKESLYISQLTIGKQSSHQKLLLNH